MKKGPLNRRIRIERATVTTDASGAEVPTWAELATVAAQKLDQRPTEAWRAGGTASTLEIAWQIRWSQRVAGVTSEDRIVYDGRVYEMLGEPTEIGRREGLRFVTIGKGAS